MNRTFESIILGVFCVVVALFCFFGARSDADKRANWIETEATVISAVDVTSSDEPGETWSCEVEYTREDGSVWTADGITVSHRMAPGEQLGIIYDPDSEEMQSGGKPEDITHLDTIAMVIAAVGAIACFGMAGWSAIRKAGDRDQKKT